MRLSISVADHSWPDGPASIGPRIARIARTADRREHVPDLGHGRGDARSPAQLVKHYGRLSELDFQHVIFESSGPWTEESLELYASIIPDVEKF